MLQQPKHNDPPASTPQQIHPLHPFPHRNNRLPGCTLPRHVLVPTGRLSPACSMSHYLALKEQQRAAVANNPVAVNQTPTPVNPSNTTRNTTPTAQQSTTPTPVVTQHRVCHLCSGSHLVLACPILTEERRTSMEAEIGYRHTIQWWTTPTQRDSAIAFRTRYTVTHKCTERPSFWVVKPKDTSTSEDNTPSKMTKGTIENRPRNTSWRTPQH